MVVPRLLVSQFVSTGVFKGFMEFLVSKFKYCLICKSDLTKKIVNGSLSKDRNRTQLRKLSINFISLLVRVVSPITLFVWVRLSFIEDEDWRRRRGGPERRK